MPKKIYTLFRGVGGFDCGAEQAGEESIGGVEYDPAIAADCDRNFPHAPTTVADIREVDPALLPVEAPDHVHASPSCKNASVANQAKNEDGTKETEFDRECGRATCRFIDHWRPEIFTLENVYAYRNFDAFGYILDSLRSGGYSFDYWHLNAADYGVPQTRKRLILVAKKGNHHIVKPPATHHDPYTRVEGQLSMFEEPTRPWIGWYEALEDLLPALPDSKFADWQLTRLPEELKTLLMDSRNTNQQYGKLYRESTEPSITVTVIDRPSHMPRALLFANTGGHESYGKHRAEQGEPAGAITAQSMGRAKAFLVGKNYDAPSCASVRHVQTFADTDPAMTITASVKNELKVFVVDQLNGGRELPTVRNATAPIFTLTGYRSKHPAPRSYIGARVVSLTPEALARLQSFPDGFLFSTKKSLAATEIGNAVPPLLARRVVESLL